MAFGDSLTVGVGATSEDSYPSVLGELSGLEVIGSGVSGETTAGGLARFASVLENTNPDFLILLEGGNDILRNVERTQTKSNLAAMITLAQGKGIQILLIGVPEKKLFSKVAPLYKELAEEHNVVLVEKLLGNLLRQPKYKSDPIHLNAAGYRVMAESIVEQMEEMGAL
ncbi:MAG: GDSL-type esterase/lipase family protein [Pseudomonadota bacterium]